MTRTLKWWRPGVLKVHVWVVAFVLTTKESKSQSKSNRLDEVKLRTAWKVSSSFTKPVLGPEIVTLLCGVVLSGEVDFEQADHSNAIARIAITLSIRNDRSWDIHLI